MTARSSFSRFVAIAAAAAAFAFGSAAHGQALYIMNGVTKDVAVPGDDSFAYVVDYSEPFNENFSYSLVYVNEGHLVDHHRDGIGAQFWGTADFLNKRLTLALGVGPYLYFDTAARPRPLVSADNHGVGIISSLAATWHLTPRWGLQVRANRINTTRSIDTTSYMLGVGYKFDAAALPGSSAPWPGSRTDANEVTAYFGKTYVNNFESETASAYALEYRRNLMRNVDWTVSAMSEGNPGPIDRRGVMTELWLTRTVFKDRVAFGAGVGPYLAYDRRDNDSARVSGVVSLTAAYRFPNHWVARATWHRVATKYDKDTDVFFFGAGYRW